MNIEFKCTGGDALWVKRISNFKFKTMEDDFLNQIISRADDLDDADVDDDDEEEEEEEEDAEKVDADEELDDAEEEDDVVAPDDEEV